MNKNNSFLRRNFGKILMVTGFGLACFAVISPAIQTETVERSYFFSDVDLSQPCKADGFGLVEKAKFVSKGEAEIPTLEISCLCGNSQGKRVEKEFQFLGKKEVTFADDLPSGRGLVKTTLKLDKEGIDRLSFFTSDELAQCRYPLKKR
jgi:hypothetical protein